MSLDTWLGTGKKVHLGGREVYVMPLPISRLKDIADFLQSKVHEELGELLRKQREHPDATMFVVEILKRIDATDMVFPLLSISRNPETGKPVNDWLTKEYVEEYLDAPSVRQIAMAFIEVNQLEELLKNLKGLPWISQVLESLTMTFGISLLNSLRQNMGSAQDRPEDSPIPSSVDTFDHSTDGWTSGTGEGEPSQEPTIQ